MNPRSFWSLDTKNLWILMKPVAPFLSKKSFCCGGYPWWNSRGICTLKIHTFHFYTPVKLTNRHGKNTTRRFGWYEKPGKKIADFPCHGDLLDLLSWPGRVTCLLRSKLSTIWIEELNQDVIHTSTLNLQRPDFNRATKKKNWLVGLYRGLYYPVI